MPGPALPPPRPARAPAGKPIASLAFHPRADVLAIGCGHKLYVWEYAAHGKLPVIGARTHSACAGWLLLTCWPSCVLVWEYAVHGKLPTIGALLGLLWVACLCCLRCLRCSRFVCRGSAFRRCRCCASRCQPCTPNPPLYPAVLKTRRSMRAVHFHPHGLPVVLTAEVQDPSPTPDLPATLTEDGPYVSAAQQQQQRRQRQQQRSSASSSTSSDCGMDEGGYEQQQQDGAEEEEAAQQAARGARGGAAAAPPSGELPIPSPQLLQGARAGQQEQQQPAAGVYVATADGPVPVGQLGGSDAAALSRPLHQLHLGRAASASPPPPADAAGPGPSSLAAAAAAAAGGPAGRPGAPGWVPPGSAQLPPSMVPTGWELPFPASLFTGGAGGGERGGGSGGAGADPAGQTWAAQAASLPQVMAAFSAAAWNIIGEEQPPRVRLRLWR